MSVSLAAEGKGPCRQKGPVSLLTAIEVLRLGWTPNGRQTPG
jgi:hypothetical protein